MFELIFIMMSFLALVLGTHYTLVLLHKLGLIDYEDAELK